MTYSIIEEKEIKINLDLIFNNFSEYRTNLQLIYIQIWRINPMMEQILNEILGLSCQRLLPLKLPNCVTIATRTKRIVGRQKNEICDGAGAGIEG